MGQQTDMEWCDSSANPTMGCDGCELWIAAEKTCYAGILHERYGGTNKGFAPTFDQVTLFPGRMKTAMEWSDLRGKDRPKKPWLNGLPRVIFVSDMSDALSKAVSFDFLKTEIIDNAVSEKGSRHILMWLTKQPQRMAALSAWLLDRSVDWPENLWPGTSLTTQATIGRVDSLRRVGNMSTTRFLSVEPIRSDIDLNLPVRGRDLSLIIVGGESGTKRTTTIGHIRMVAEQCADAGANLFVKQIGNHPVNREGIAHPVRDPKGGDMAEWPSDLRIRQFPQLAEKVF